MMRPVFPFALLCIAWAFSELWIGARRRAGKAEEVRDQGTLRVLIATIGLCLALALTAASAQLAPLPAPWPQRSYWMGCAMMLIGMPLRGWSVRALAQFFTIDVAIRPGHRLIRSGPYRLLRHPSYTGALLTFYGFAFALGDALAVAIVIVPVTAAFLHRIRVEEQVLADAFPDDYPAYARETKRLIPFIW